MKVNSVSNWMKYIKARYKTLNLKALSIKDYDEAFHGSYLHRGSCCRIRKIN